jgi:hypothetical protein
VSPTLDSVTQRIYRLVVAGMTVIALLAVIRSFAGGNELAGQRLGWGVLAFTYPGMWDLLGIIGSVLWVGTRPGLAVRRWGVGMTIVAVLVVGVSLASEAYLVARDVLGGGTGGAGLPEAAAVMGFLVPVVYCVLTHVAAQCRVALDLAPEEESSTPTTTTPAPASSGSRPSATSSTPAPLPTLSPAPSRSGTHSERPAPAIPPESTPGRGWYLPNGTPPSTGASPGPFTRSSPDGLPPTPPPSSTASPLTPSTDTTTPPTSPGGAPQSGSAAPTAPSAPPADEQDTDELELERTAPSPSSSAAASSSTGASSSPAPPSPPQAPPPGLDRDDPNRWPTPDGLATREARRRWVLDELRAGREVSGADVETRFGPPRSGAAIVREARSRLDVAELEGALR